MSPSTGESFAYIGNGYIRATVGDSLFEIGHYELPLPISFAVSGHVPGTDVRFIDGEAGVIKSIARLKTEDANDCVMVEELWYAHNHHKNVMVHSVKINNPSSHSVTAQLDTRVQKGGGGGGAGIVNVDGDDAQSANRKHAEDVAASFRPLKNATMVEKDKENAGTKVLIGQVTSGGTAHGDAPLKGTGIIIYSTVPETLLVLPGRTVQQQTLVVAATINAEFDPAVDYGSEHCWSGSASEGRREKRAVDGQEAQEAHKAVCSAQAVYHQLVALYSETMHNKRLLKSHEVSWEAVLPIDLEFEKLDAWGSLDRSHGYEAEHWDLPAQVWSTLYYVLSGAQEHKASAVPTLGEECYNGKPLRNDFDLWHETPQSRQGVTSLVEKWIALLQASECIVVHAGTRAQVSRATLMEAITYAIVGVHVSTKKASLTVHPSWNLKSGESIEIGPLKFDDHVVRIKLSKYTIEVTRLDHLSEPVLALEKDGPSIVLDELGKLVLPAGVLYLSHDEQRLHEHRHEDEELHMPPPGYQHIAPTDTPRFSKSLIGLLISGVVLFHIFLGLIFYREYCRKSGRMITHVQDVGNRIKSNLSGGRKESDYHPLAQVSSGRAHTSSGDENEGSSGGIRGSYKGRNRLGGNVVAGTPTRPKHGT